MLLFVLTLIVIAAVSYAHFREGLLNAMSICFITLFAGMMAFQFWPAVAEMMESLFKGSFLEQYEDAVALVVVFCACAGLLRFITVRIVPKTYGIVPKLNQIGGAIFGVITGYFVAGFLCCVLQTMPWNKDFLGFQHRDPGFEDRLFPADQNWLKLMNRCHYGTFTNGEDQSHILSSFAITFLNERRKGENIPQGAPAPLPIPGQNMPPKLNPGIPETKKGNRPPGELEPKQPPPEFPPKKDD